MTIPTCPRCRTGQLLTNLDGETACLQCGFEPNQPAPLPLVFGNADYPARKVVAA